MYKKRKIKWLFFLAPVIILFTITAIVFWLWNALLPSLFGLPFITYWQAMGLLVLCKILFGGIGGKGFGNKPCQNYRKPYAQKDMEIFSSADKEQFKERFKQFCSRKKNTI